MEIQTYSAMFHSDEQADWVVNKLLSYGIKAWREGNCIVKFITTPKR